MGDQAGAVTIAGDTPIGESHHAQALALLTEPGTTEVSCGYCARFGFDHDTLVTTDPVTVTTLIRWQIAHRSELADRG